MVVAGIYKIESPSGKIYIGQSKNIKRRMYGYSRKLCLPKTKIYSSIKKYGFKNHTIDIIHELPKDVDRCILDIYEDFYIKQYSGCGLILLNMKDGGGGNRGLNEDSRRKISIGNKGKKQSKEFIENLSKRMIGKKYALGYKHTDEAKRRIGEKLKKSNHPKAVKLISEKTGKIYGCIRDAAEEYNMNSVTLVNQLSGHRKNKTDLKYYLSV